MAALKHSHIQSKAILQNTTPKPLSSPSTLQPQSRSNNSLSIKRQHRSNNSKNISILQHPQPSRRPQESKLPRHQHLFPPNQSKKAANVDGLVFLLGFVKRCCRWSKTAEYRGIRVVGVGGGMVADSLMYGRFLRPPRYPNGT